MGDAGCHYCVDGGDMCGAVDGVFRCTREKDHERSHVACGTRRHEIHTWDTEVPVVKDLVNGVDEDLAMVSSERVELMEAIQQPRRCYVCGAQATCVGRYEGRGPVQYGCDTHCGHGCEDGWCVKVPSDTPWHDVTESEPSGGRLCLCFVPPGTRVLLSRSAPGTWWTVDLCVYKGAEPARFMYVPNDEVRGE